MTTAQQVAQITKTIPVNTLGLLEGIYRTDLMPSPLVVDPHASSTALTVQEDQTQYNKEMQIAYVPMDYEEGYPTLNGKPFWSKLFFEPDDAYLCFEVYRMQGNSAMRTIYNVLDAKEVTLHNVTLEQLQEYYHMYYWAARVKAYDIFQGAFKRRQQEVRMMETNDSHYLMATRLMDMCTLYLDENGEEMMETLTPKAFIELLKTAAQLQRVSAGLPANGPAGSNESAGSMEMILRTVAHQMNGGQNPQQANSGNEAAKNTQDKLAQVMADPVSLQFAQELIIRMNTPRTPT